MKRSFMIIQMFFFFFLFDDFKYGSGIQLTDLCNGLKTNRLLSSIEENAEENFLRDPIAGVIVELSNPLLENLKRLWLDLNSTTFATERTMLATFDSSGLLTTNFYDETSKFMQKLKTLKESRREASGLSKTFHVIEEVIQKNLSNGSLLLITSNTPSDSDYSQILLQNLLLKNLQLSVIWMDISDLNDKVSLDAVAKKTGGELCFLSKDPEMRENFKMELENDEKFTENITDAYNRVRFPEEVDEDASREMNVSSRFGEEITRVGKLFFPLIVEVESGAMLEMEPGTVTRIPFTVKNNFNSGLKIVFGAKLNGVPQLVLPERVSLQPSSSIRVLVTIPANSNPPTNALSILSFSAFTFNKPTTRSAMLSLVPQTTTDYTAPYVTYKFEGDCSKYSQPQYCEQQRWGVQVTVQDEDSGILMILSEPYGLLFQPNFIAGTKQPVTAYYSASCCQPKVDIWAEDLRGNYVKKSFDVFNQGLLTGEIAAIVVGVLLLIFLIIAIIVTVVLIKRRNSRNLIIPRPRSASR